MGQAAAAGDGGSGIGLAYLFYIEAAGPAGARGRVVKPVYQLVFNKWYFDELYAFLFVAAGRRSATRCGRAVTAP